MEINRIAVVIPGIMGSCLEYTNSAGTSTEIWGGNFYENYKRLLSNPTLLRWNGVPAEARLLENVYASNYTPWPKYQLWQRLLDYLSNHSEFEKKGRMIKFAYDWRQSLMDTAQSFGSFLQAHVKNLASTEGIPPADYRFVLLTHSMGGLIVRISLALKGLQPKSVDRIVHIGCPLLGAASAFRPPTVKRCFRCCSR